MPRGSATQFARVGHVLPNWLRIGMAFSAAIATAVLVGACGSGIPGDAVAVVGSAPITKAAFLHWETVANDSNQASTGVKAPPLPVPPDYTACIAYNRTQSANAGDTSAQLKASCAEDYTSLNNEVMSFLIEALWVEGAAFDRGVKSTPAAVAKAFAQQRKTSTPPLTTQKALNEFLAKSGQTLTDLKWRTRLSVLATGIQEQIAKKADKVTSAQIAAYYKKNHSQFVTPETRAIHLIETDTEAQAKTVMSELASGTTYAALAKTSVDIDPTTKATAGAESVRPGQLTAQVSAAVFAAPVDKLEGPVKTAFGYYVFTVDSSTPEKVTSLKQATAGIKAAIQTSQESAANTKFGDSFESTWSSRTKCATGYIVATYCGNAPKTGSTGSTGAAG